MARERLDGDSRREQIVWAAVRLAAGGVRNVTIKGIAQAIGVVPSAIYRHFGNKEAVMDAVVDMVTRRLTDKGREAGLAESDVLSAIRRLGRYHVHLMSSEPGLIKLVFSELGQPTSSRGRQVMRLTEAYRGMVADMVRRGQAMGQIRPDLVPEDLVFLYVGALIPPAMLFHMSGGEFDVAGQFERSFEVLERLARVQPDAAAEAGNAGGGHGCH